MPSSSPISTLLLHGTGTKFAPPYLRNNVFQQEIQKDTVQHSELFHLCLTLTNSKHNDSLCHTVSLAGKCPVIQDPETRVRAIFCTTLPPSHFIDEERAHDFAKLHRFTRNDMSMTIMLGIPGKLCGYINTTLYTNASKTRNVHESIFVATQRTNVGCIKEHHITVISK